jgi:hypothetical protein
MDCFWDEGVEKPVSIVFEVAAFRRLFSTDEVNTQTICREHRGQ